MDMHTIFERISFVIPLILSLSVHEWAHAISAYKLGDDTALRQGRLTLNPLPHIDPIGTLLLPMMGVPFGWAKPVPVNPSNFRRDVSMGRGMMITAAAGPASNVVLAVLCTVVFALMLKFAPGFFLEQRALVDLLQVSIGLNVALAVFNMLPVPPLDGSRVADGLMPYRFREQWEQFARFGPLVLIGVIIFADSILRWPMSLALEVLRGLIGWIV